ncbi:hypothetical protein K402DRAFT_405121 [Aulographum hederae CBS 113979]|uniref:Heterokaryon incompatibility domain-containing protein n=1 Tax=Aulographum hederae CBS 113979 TaxID=1176131 RepID=A0A6G1GXI5_9PEZI|nr:hypothetical protein K402DRAFT_405121 [Aulographum hederae CBS 113979]
MAQSIYEPLNHEHSNAIRLAKLSYNPHPEIAFVRCSLFRTDLSSGRPYSEALSYTWGPPSPVRDISVNGSYLSIRENLYDFLYTNQQDQEFCENTDLFIDQICINQTDIRERNHQVAQMAQVYQIAKEVIIWLGAESEDSVLFMNTFRQWKDLDFPIRDGMLLAEMIASQRYWQRLWIMQEVLLAREVIIFWGRSSLAWNDLFQILDSRRSKTPLDDRIQHLWLGRRGKDLWGGEGYKWDWAAAVSYAKGSQCEDKRDKIFGLLGLIDPELAISPDYSKSVRDIFLEILLKQTDFWGEHTVTEYRHLANLWATELGLLTKIL